MSKNDTATVTLESAGRALIDTIGAERFLALTPKQAVLATLGVTLRAEAAGATWIER